MRHFKEPSRNWFSVSLLNSFQEETSFQTGRTHRNMTPHASDHPSLVLTGIDRHTRSGQDRRRQRTGTGSIVRFDCIIIYFPLYVMVS